MRTIFKRSLCLLLCVALAFSLSACGGTAMTEGNITKTVSLVEKALREFDKDTLQKYVSSKTLYYIIKMASNKEQVDRIGKLMFENLEIKVTSVDAKNGKVVAQVKNKDLRLGGQRYVKMLHTKSHGKATEMLTLFNDDEFLDLSERMLTAQISQATVPDNPVETTFTVNKEKGHLVLVLDEAAEDAVSGGAVTAVTEALKENGTTGAKSVTTTLPTTKKNG